MIGKTEGRKAAATLFIVAAFLLIWLWIVDRYDLLAVKHGTPMFSRETFPPDGVSPNSPDFIPNASVGIGGVETPRLRRAEEVQIAADEAVIGVALDGEARAYVVGAFEVNGIRSVEDIAAHLVHDVVAGRPICVTHCDRTHSTRVLTKTRGPSAAPTPLDVRIGGWERGMILVVDGARFVHHSPELPLDDVRFETTTWAEWLARHPNTLVYVGVERS